MGAGDEQVPHATFESVDAADEFGVLGHAGLQHASTNAKHGESPKSFRLISGGPVRLGERCTCYYLPSYEAQQSMLLALTVSLTVGFSVTTGKRQGDACEREGMHGHGQDAQADPQRCSNEMERAQEYGPARAIGVGVLEASFQLACRSCLVLSAVADACSAALMPQQMQHIAGDLGECLRPARYA